MDYSFDNLNYNSIENVPGFEARAAFTLNNATVFKEDVDIVPTTVDETLSYIPWGDDNQLPYNVIDLYRKGRNPLDVSSIQRSGLFRFRSAL